jgi:hypothetical protein
MASKRFFSQVWLGGLAILLAAAICPAADDTVAFKFVPGQLQITIGGKDFATYVFSHPKVTRPFFMSVKTPSGIQATRNFPPVQGVDDVDHDTFHPGIWHSFGDISGRDYWRNKCKVEHELFSEAPQGGPGRGTFTVRNYYQDEQGNRKVLELCKYTILARPGYTLLIQDSSFSSTEEDFYFGDQEEMGFGMRVNTKIAERYGGTMVNADGLKGAKACWSQASAWIDYSGVVEGTRIGMTLMPDPANFRASWYHARDYGLIVANPFGRKSMEKGEADKTSVKKGQSFRYRNGVAIHSGPEGAPADPGALYKAYLEAIGSRK